MVVWEEAEDEKLQKMKEKGCRLRKRKHSKKEEQNQINGIMHRGIPSTKYFHFC